MTGIHSVEMMKVITEGVDLRQFWELESLGIMDDGTPKHSQINDEAIRILEASTTMKNGRYEVGLPWKQEANDLSDNLDIATKRMRQLGRRFLTDISLFDRYEKVILDYLKEGIAEIVKDEEMALPTSGRTYYMPHHAIIRDDKATTKLRVVFDASSHPVGHPSLNDCLITGPNLNPDLVDVLFNFRQHRIAFVADVEKAFLQISLSERDRDAVRFLWFEDGIRKGASPKLKSLRMTRVVFGISASPFLLAGTIRLHLKKYTDSFPETAQTLRDNLYVDDFIAGADDEDKADLVRTESKTIMSEAGMNLRKWKSNSTSLEKLWNEEPMEENLCFSTENPELSSFKVLGLTWNSRNDEFIFEIQGLLDFLSYRKNTKRCVLQAAARIFDPLGFMSPFVIRIKCLFQELWERKLSWDGEFPTDLTLKWDAWCLELPLLQDVAINRHYFSNVSKDEIKYLELHAFCDASIRAYGAVVYVRYVTTSEKIGVSFVVSKSRVAPLKKLSLPRLELMGALIATRLVTHLKHQVKVFKDSISQFWSDSTIALHWIKGEARSWKPFVANRVVEIQSKTDPEAWHHVKGSENPADPLSRGLNSKNICTNVLWWRGPPWLILPKDQLELQNKPNLEPEEMEEIKREQRPSYVLQATCNVTTTEGTLLDLDHFSSLSRVLRVTAWIFRFTNNARKRNKTSEKTLVAAELEQAEMFWTKTAQREGFGAELNLLRAAHELPKKSKLTDLSPFLDDYGQLRVGGRLQCSTLEYSQKHPIVLPSKHRFTELIILDCHKRVMHTGLRDTLTQVREKYWVPRGRQVTKTLLRHCIICKKFLAKTATEKMEPIPKERITENPSFMTSGVDFAGPLYIKGTSGSEKAYIALFTCGVTRAVHLELVSDLSKENFMMAFRRFIARRGVPQILYSDNACTFKRAEKDLKDLWKTLTTDELRNFFAQHRVNWKFIVAKAPWWGGFYERLVRSVKTCLKKTLGKAALTYEEMETALLETEAVINSRPLTYTANEAGEPIALAPANFLIGSD